MAMSRDEIYKKVQAVLVDALGVDEEEVTPNAVIKDDLGAESIDFLDIVFRLEKAFGIKIPRGEMMPENLANDPNVVQVVQVLFRLRDVLQRRRRLPRRELDELVDPNPTHGGG